MVKRQKNVRNYSKKSHPAKYLSIIPTAVNNQTKARINNKKLLNRKKKNKAKKINHSNRNMW